MMRMFEWRGRLTLVAIWLLLAAPAHAGGASLNHDYGSSGPEAPASLDVSQPAVNFSLYDFSAVDFDGALLGELLGRPHAHGAQAFLALFSPGHRDAPERFPGHDADYAPMDVEQWWIQHLGPLAHNIHSRASQVPEPSSGLMLTLGLAAWMSVRRRARV
ncbi:MAG: PEP-CTERM sorting domain-containing protein [Myxococcota bacterium]